MGVWAALAIIAWSSAATTTSGDLIYRVARPVNIDGLGAGGNELADSAWAAAAPRA